MSFSQNNKNPTSKLMQDSFFVWGVWGYGGGHWGIYGGYWGIGGKMGYIWGVFGEKILTNYFLNGLFTSAY